MVAASTLLNAIFAVCGALLIYIGAAPLAAICRVPFRSTAQTSLSCAVHFALLIPIVYLLQPHSLIPNGTWKHIALVLAVTVVALWMTFARFPSSRLLFLPKLLTCLLIPASVVLLAQEAIQTSRGPGRGVDRLAEKGGIQHPDIILITLDALSAPHLHTYGYERHTSPNLDELAASAVVFDNFYANANWTRPGVASILNGVRPWTHEGDVQTPSKLFTDQQNLIAILSSVGYDVNVVQSNAWADFGSQGIKPVAHREIFLDCCYNLFSWLSMGREPLATDIGPIRIMKWVINWAYGGLSMRPPGKTDVYLPLSLEILRNTYSHRPLFLWIHVILPHDPYAATAPFVGVFDRSDAARSTLTSDADYFFHSDIIHARQNLLLARYDEAILMTDDLIGKLIKMLKEQGRYDHSLIVITADHGESFLPIYGGHGGPLLTEELIRVPCLIKPPQPFTPKHESLLMEQADLLPTILSYAELPLPRGSEGQAYPGKPDNVPVFSMNRDLQGGEKTLNVAMREGEWKYVVHLGRWNHPWPQRELYDLAQDPKEQVNLVNSQPERAAAMQQCILTKISQHGISLSEYQH
jgi:hypothetical protein